MANAVPRKATVSVPVDRAGSRVGPREMTVGRAFVVSAAAAGIAFVGGLFGFSIWLLCMPILIWIGWQRAKEAYHSVVEEGRIRITLPDTLWCFGGLALGYFFWTALGCAIYHLGELLLIRSEQISRRGLIDVLDNLPEKVFIDREGCELEVGLQDLSVGDTILVGEGDVLAADGVIVGGAASIDLQRLTGESVPTEKGVGDEVYAGTRLVSGSLHVRVEKAGKETALARIGQIVNRTAQFKLALESRGEQMTDRAAAPTMVLAGVCILTVGPGGALAVLGNYPGVNLRLFCPMTMLNALKETSRRGILVKDGRSLEAIGEIDTVVFDKTGTLTTETPELCEIHVWSHFEDDDALLAYAASMERRKSHPLARGILAAADERGLELRAFDDLKYEVGYGLKAQVDGRTILLGSARHMEREGVALSPSIESVKVDSESRGQSLVLIAVGGEICGALQLRSRVRAEASDVIAHLRSRNIRVIILSGDQLEPTRELAARLRVDQFFAASLPATKGEILDDLQKAGHKVCFVGDGVNDSIALRKSDVSVSLAGAAKAATDAADVVLMDGDLKGLPDLFAVADRLQRVSNGNIRNSYALSMLTVAGVFVLHVGFVPSLLMYSVALGGGIANSTRRLKPYDDVSVVARRE